MKNWHSLKIEEIIDILTTDLTGLSEEEVKNRLSLYGYNKLPEEKKINPIFLFLKQFKNIFNILLLLAFIFSLYLNKTPDAIVILIIIFINALIGFIFEYRAEEVLNKLRKLIKPKAKVIRGGELNIVDSENLVPGDIIVVEEGDYIPADIRLFEAENLKIDESLITGESLPVLKTTQILPLNTLIQERKNICFMGSYVFEGRGKGIVVETGLNTYLGNIYKKYKEEKKIPSHFIQISKELLFKMSSIAFFLALIIFVLSIKNKIEISEALLFTLSALISAIPEGLPIIITLTLSISAYYLSRKNIIVKSLPSVESLSVVDTILTDKTGTLTQNVMTAKKIFLWPETEIEVSGEMYEPIGNFYLNGKIINPLDDLRLVKLLHILICSSDAELIKENNEWKIKGDPRDAAMLVVSEKVGLKREIITQSHEIIKKIPFSYSKKYKGAIVKHKNVETFIVGAFDKIVEISNFVFNGENIENIDKTKLLEVGENYAKEGFSVLGAAFSTKEDEDFIFVGFIALYDPPKKGIEEAIEKIKEAKVDVKILTGDHKETAIHIAKEIGLNNLNCLTEKEIQKMSDEELKNLIPNVGIFARVLPDTKLRILNLYQEIGKHCAYIGDGVNDVLALKKSELGVVMGKRGSEIAKSAGDIILLNDEFNSLVDAIIEGRKVFNNLRRTTFFLITTNVAESITIISSLLLKLPLILKPIHILFLNLVTDTLCGTFLAFEKEHGKEIKLGPRRYNESLINLQLLPFLFLIAFLMNIITLYLFVYEYTFNLEKARTYAFLVMSFTQIFNALNLRSLYTSLFKLKITTNPALIYGIISSTIVQYLAIYHPYINKLLGFSKISYLEFIFLIFLSSLVLFGGEAYKFIRNKLAN